MLFYLLIFIFSIFCILKFFLKGTVKKCQQRMEAWGMSDPENMNKLLGKHKENLFETLKNIVSKDPSLSLRILEIGVGSGSNFKYYPKNVSLIALDPNPYFKKYFDIQKEKFPEIHLEKHIQGFAEDMTEIKSNSVDVVVCTLVCCCVEDPQKVYKEIKRVLVEGGKFYFYEHISAEPGTFISKLQNFLTVTGIWPLLNDECKLNTKLDKETLKAGFSNVDQTKLILNVGKYFILHLIAPNVYGIATK